jgi:hypothetical protein
MTTATTTDLSRFCSVCAKQAGVDAVGHAYVYHHFVAGELPLPWPESMYSDPGILPKELLDFRQVLIDAYERGESMHVGAYAIAPDKEYSVPGHRRVISYKRPDGPFAVYEQEEYLVPEEEFGPLCWALLVEHASVPRFDAYRLPSSTTRDLLVCTHGAVDAACAKFGFPIYRHLRRLADQSGGQFRAWRVSHFGGHVFAPTLIDMPEFRYWGYVEREKAELLANHTGDAAELRECYRGWAGLEDALLQVAERELFVRHGWPWLDYLKTGQVLSQEEVPSGDHNAEPSWGEVRIDYITPDGSERGSYTARVEITSRVECIYSTGYPETYGYPQYTVTRLERVE